MEHRKHKNRISRIAHRITQTFLPWQKGDMRYAMCDTRFVRGFTVTEMLITLAIIGLISAIVLFNHTSFTDRLEVKTAADTFVLALREAQVEGLAVRETGVDGEFSAGYGVFIDRNALDRFVYFADSTNSGTQKEYDGLDELERLEEFLYGVEIDPQRTCGYHDGGSDCLSNGNDITIVFARPRPSPIIRISGTREYEYVTVYLTSNEDRDALILLERSGQVSVDYVPE